MNTTRKAIFQQHMLAARQAQRKQLAVLIDPDRQAPDQLDGLLGRSLLADVDFFLVGGSLLTANALDATLVAIKNRCNKPIVLFPGSIHQISSLADALLFLSLISGRNPELLIGNHVLAAPMLRESGLEVLPTGYMLIDGGRPTTVSYISNTLPIPADKPDIAACTAMAGEMLGLGLIYLDSGSGALQAVSPATISAVRQVVSLPIIVGGGIRRPEQALAAWQAGADVVVVGNAFEREPELVHQFAELRTATLAE